MIASFLKGCDVTVTADGARVGGVISVECGQNNTVEKIEEYLTDVPVSQLSSSSYYVKLRMRVQPYSSIGLNPSSVTLAYGNKRVSYTGCCVESVKCEILPDSAVEYAVMISAGERSVENV